MSDNISFPIDNMRQIAQQITSDTEALSGETNTRIQQMHNTGTGLPSSMQGGFSELFGQLQRNMEQILALRQSIGQTLTQAAELAASTEQAIDAPMTRQ
jgi:uncharacterized protein YukE